MDDKFEINDMMTFVYKMFLGNEAVFVTLVGYILIAGFLNIIKYFDHLMKGGD